MIERANVSKANSIVSHGSRTIKDSVHQKQAETFAMNLRSLTSQSPISRRQLAKVIGISHSEISKYYAGHHVPHPETLQKLADYFHVTPDYLLGNDTSQPKPASVSSLDQMRRVEPLMNVAVLLSDAGLAELLAYANAIRYREIAQRAVTGLHDYRPPEEPASSNRPEEPAASSQPENSASDEKKPGDARADSR